MLRQHPVDRYFLDFFLPEPLLCIEIDGSLHENRVCSDDARDEVLAALGIETVRIQAATVLRDPILAAESIRRIACDRLGRKLE